MLSKNPVVELSLEDIKFLVWFYTNPSMEDDDRLRNIKELISKLPPEDQIIMVLHLEDYDFRSIGLFISKSHTYCIHRWHDILNQMKAL